MGCKRILLSDDFYPALTKPGVQLVDQAVVRATPTGVITADGRAHALDVLVCATGFQVADAGAPFELRGLGGRELNAQWAGGPQAYLGTVVAGFPNLFVMTGPNTGLGHNSMVYIIESQTRFVVAALRALEARRARAFDTRAEVQAGFNEELQRKLARTVWNTGGCRSWYLAADGSNRVLWPDFTFRFRQRLARFDWQDYRAIGAAA
jgi:cation diffusion facilitator CzcD-associated flavoprotein CzcO